MEDLGFGALGARVFGSWGMMFRGLGFRPLQLPCLLLFLLLPLFLMIPITVTVSIANIVVH